VLWISDDGFPDLGGNIGEENCFLDEVCFMIQLFAGLQCFQFHAELDYSALLSNFIIIILIIVVVVVTSCYCD